MLQRQEFRVATGQSRKLPVVWETSTDVLADADERVELSAQISEENASFALDELRRINNAHEFLSKHGVTLTVPAVDPANRRDIEDFKIEALRLKPERHGKDKVSNRTAVQVRKFPKDNTSLN